MTDEDHVKALRGAAEILTDFVRDAEATGLIVAVNFHKGKGGFGKGPPDPTTVEVEVLRRL